MKIGKKIVLGVEEYVFADVLLQGYEDITSVSNFIKIGNDEFKDYKWIRKRLQECAADWANLSVEDKREVAKRKASTETNCIDTLGDAYNFWMTDFDNKSRECRNIRFSTCKTILRKNVTLSGQYQVLAVLDATPTLEANYIKHGVEGISEGDPFEGFFDFIEAKNSYATTGLAAMDLTMTGLITKAEMIIEMMECLRNGNY